MIDTALAAAAESTSVGTLRGIVVLVLVAVGLFFLGVGTVGILRLPTVYNRMHATSKATTLGAGVIALAGWVFYGPADDGLLALVTVAFLFLTAPTGAHMISRAAQRMGVPFLEDVSWPDPPEPAGSRTGSRTPEETRPADRGDEDPAGDD